MSYPKEIAELIVQIELALSRAVSLNERLSELSAGYRSTCPDRDYAMSAASDISTVERYLKICSDHAGSALTNTIALRNL